MKLRAASISVIASLMLAQVVCAEDPLDDSTRMRVSLSGNEAVILPDTSKPWWLGILPWRRQPSRRWC